MLWHIVLLFLLADAAGLTRAPRDIRTKCPTGTSEENGVTCCTCLPGHYITKHCSATDQVECLPCETGFYNSFYNSSSCTPCTSCNQNVFLEEKTPCSSTQDTQCKCKHDHYCSDEKCSHCVNCEMCETYGGKAPCKTSCEKSEKSEKNSRLTAGYAVIIFFVISGSIAVGVFFCFRRKCRSTQEGQYEADKPSQLELNPLVKDMDLNPYLYTVVEMIGLTEIKKLALRGGITQAMIDMHVQSYPNNVKEQCFYILKDWYEKQGLSGTPKVLISELNKMGLKASADKLVKKFNEDNKGTEMI